ncbi:unnamed protein product, partial [Prorocentrum cordatum]
EEEVARHFSHSPATAPARPGPRHGHGHGLGAPGRADSTPSHLRGSWAAPRGWRLRHRRGCNVVPGEWTSERWRVRRAPYGSTMTAGTDAGCHLAKDVVQSLLASAQPQPRKGVYTLPGHMIDLARHGRGVQVSPVLAPPL